MNKPIMMLMLLIVLGCAAVDDPMSVGVAAERKAGVSKNSAITEEYKPSSKAMEVGRRDYQQDGDDNHPMWIISSEQHTAQTKELGTKARSRKSKPQGPFSIRYVLEGWAFDDHRLLVEIQSSRAIDDWRIDLGKIPGLREIESKRLKSEVGLNQWSERKMLRFGSLPEMDRLLITVSVDAHNQTASKTVTVPLRESKVKTLSSCLSDEAECIIVTPGRIQ